MKTIFNAVLFTIAVSFAWTADWETTEIIDRLRTFSGPEAPVIIENSVIFTASSSVRRIGVAFAHENFTNIHWFRQLLVSQDRLYAPIPPGKDFPDPYKDSGIQFHVYQVPENINELEYRLIINGLWTVDPANSRVRKDPVSGLYWSVLSIPHRTPKPDPYKSLPGGITFTIEKPPGETVAVAGNFNGWDPFMYELKEGPPGIYSIIIPLPPGTYQYVFFHRGQRYVDPNNPRRIYAKDRSAASLIDVP